MEDLIAARADPPNGLELSGPARLLSTQKRVLAGSAPAICYAYPMHGRLAEAERLLQQGSGNSGEGPLAAAIQSRAGFDTPRPSLQRRLNGSADDGLALAGETSEMSCVQLGQMFKAHRSIVTVRGGRSGRSLPPVKATSPQESTQLG